MKSEDKTLSQHRRDACNVARSLAIRTLGALFFFQASFNLTASNVTLSIILPFILIPITVIGAVGSGVDLVERIMLHHEATMQEGTRHREH